MAATMPPKKTGTKIFSLTTLQTSLRNQGCQIFLGTCIPKPEQMYQMNTKCTKWSLNIPNVCKIFQMALIYSNIFQSRALQNLPKLGFLVWKKPSGNPVRNKQVWNSLQSGQVSTWMAQGRHVFCVFEDLDLKAGSSQCVSDSFFKNSNLGKIFR
jgi:hypothetical protein